MCEESIFGLWQARENLLNRRMFTRRNGVSSLHMQRLKLTTMKLKRRKGRVRVFAEKIGEASWAAAQRLAHPRCAEPFSENPRYAAPPSAEPLMVSRATSDIHKSGKPMSAWCFFVTIMSRTTCDDEEFVTRQVRVCLWVQLQG